jgi:hypothetical protein
MKDEKSRELMGPVCEDDKDANMEIDFREASY